MSMETKQVRLSVEQKDWLDEQKRERYGTTDVSYRIVMDAIIEDCKECDC